MKPYESMVGAAVSVLLVAAVSCGGEIEPEPVVAQELLGLIGCHGACECKPSVAQAPGQVAWDLLDRAGWDCLPGRCSLDFGPAGKATWAYTEAVNEYAYSVTVRGRELYSCEYGVSE
jgi:hypothetical protein